MKVGICTLRHQNRDGQLNQIKELDVWSVQFGNDLLLYAANSQWDRIATQTQRLNLNVQEYPGYVRKGDMYLVVQKGRLFQQKFPDARILLDKGRYLAVELSSEKFKSISVSDKPCFVIEPLRDNTVIFDELPASSERILPATWIQGFVDDVSRPHYEATLNHLASYFTRFSTSDSYHDAAIWCQDQLNAMGYNPSLETISVGDSNSYNVITEKTGEGSSSRKLVIVVAHLDSVNSSGGMDASAPGADDNASGCAALLEIARVLKTHSSIHDLRFVLFGGEEQGLLGSLHYVSSLSITNQNRILAIVNMDMIGSLNTTAPTVLLEGGNVSQTVINELNDIASTYTSLMVQTSLHPYASDHVPFINAGLPAVLTIEGADSANSFIHTGNDITDHINFGLALEITKMNVAYTLSKLKQKREVFMPNPLEIPDKLEKPEWWKDYFIPRWFQLSGRYKYNGGASARTGLSAAEVRETPNKSVIKDPIYKLDEPIYIPDYKWFWNKLRFTLHIDIDGTDPLNVVSGTVSRGLRFTFSPPPPHFIGRVTSNTINGGVRTLIVQDFSFKWPQSSNVIDCLEIDLTGGFFITPSADVTFVDTSGNKRFGPYTVSQESKYFRDVEIEVDREDNAVDVEPYNTHTHPDRPADLPEEDLTLESTFAKSGIRITRSPSDNIINTSEAGSNNRWSEQELHDAMEDHWSAFSNKPQLKMWVFLAELANSDSLGGIMFDGDIDEPGGVDRQGTALFTLCSYFHTETGGYIQANPPTAEAVDRELFFNLIHEIGHSFNLAHSFQKTLGSPWAAPSWMPVTTDDQALSWMNYPDRPSPGANASWFYDRFRFRFDDNENLFLRHAPSSFVQMGNEDWFQNHGRISRGSLDRRLELIVRSQKTNVEMGEPINIEIRLRNKSDENVIVHPNLDPSDGFVEFAVTKPNGERRPFIPLYHTRKQVKGQILEPNHRIYHAVNMTVGKLGFPFKEPGPYRIEASYTNLDGGTAAAIMQLWVKEPSSHDDRLIINELFNARVGRVLYFDGSRTMEDVNDKLEWVSENLGEKHPIQYHISKVRATPLAYPFKRLKADSDKLTLLEPNPEMVEREFAPVLDNSENAADTIGHIEYRKIVDTYTRCAKEANKKNKALKAQNDLLSLFKKRNIIQPVINDIEKRVKELK